VHQNEPELMDASCVVLSCLW